MSVQDYLCKQVHDIEHRYRRLEGKYPELVDTELREDLDRIIIDLLEV